MGHLACGMRFHQGHLVLRKQVARAVKHWLVRDGSTFIVQTDDALHGDLNAWLPLFHGGLDGTVSEGDVRALARSSQTFGRNIATVFDRWRSERDGSYRDWFVQECAGHGRMLREAYQRHEAHIHWLRHRFDRRIGSGNALADIALIVVDEIHGRERGDLQDARRRADEFFSSAIFTDLPNVRIASALWAGLAHRLVHGNWPNPGPSISHDVDFVSSYLPYCDLLFIENACEEILTNPPASANVPEHSKIYCSRTRDRFIGALEQIEASAPADVIGASAEVYGTDDAELPAFFS